MCVFTCVFSVANDHIYASFFLLDKSEQDLERANAACPRLQHMYKCIYKQPLLGKAWRVDTKMQHFSYSTLGSFLMIFPSDSAAYFRKWLLR